MFLKDKREVYGKLKKVSGDVYEGQMENDLMNGLGICKYSDGSSFIGIWTDGMPSDGHMKWKYEREDVSNKRVQQEYLGQLTS